MGDSADRATLVERPARSGEPSAATSADPGPVAPADSAFDPPAGRFAETGELGRGGMGRVAEAHDRALGRDVAIKHMLSTEPVALARFAREARVTARLEHPSIVPLYDAGRDPDGTPYYVMRKVDGRPLDQLVANRPLAERLPLVPNLLAACDAAGYAHARGIIHRDIKPPNILIGAFGETLLIDWGLARELAAPDRDDATIADSDDAHLTRAGSVAGTPGFMAPEQARGEPTDARADVFALGATLYYVLAARLPYASTSATEMIALVGAERAPDWRAIPDEVPADLRAIVVKAMAPQREDRYPDAGALAADLRRFVTGNLVGAHDYGLIEQLRRFVRRHKAALGVAVISAVVLAIGAVFSIRGIVAERDQATIARDQATVARALAERREREAQAVADDQLVKHAAELVTTDPLAAIMTLRALPPGSARWGDAANVAESARLRGVPLGFASSTRPNRMTVGDHEVYTFDFDGKITAYDLDHRTRRELGEVPRGYSSHVWNGKLAIAGDHEVTLVDVATSAREVVPSPATTHVLYGDDKARLWLAAGDGLYELVGRRWQPLLEHVHVQFVDRALTAAVVQRDHDVVLWTPSGETPILQSTTPVYGELADDQLVIADGDRVTRWPLDASHHLGVSQRWTVSYLSGIKVFDGKLFAVSAKQLVLLGEGGQWPMSQGVELVFDTHRGLAYTRPDALVLIDHQGGFDLGMRDAKFRQIDVTTDGRYVVALTVAGAVQWWEIDRVRPQAVELSNQESFVAITTHSVWSHDGLELHRTDIATGKLDRLPLKSFLREAVISEDDRFVAVTTMAEDSVLVDRARKTAIRLDASQTTRTPTGLASLRSTGVIREFTPADPEGRDLVTLPFATADTIGQAGHFLFAARGARVARVDLATRAIDELTLPTALAEYVIADDGEIWLVADNTLFRWPGHGTLRSVLTPKPVDGVGWLAGRVVARCSGALFRVDTPTPIVLATGVRTWSTDRKMIGWVGPHDLVSLDDATHALPILLPVRASFEVALTLRPGFAAYAIDGRSKTNTYAIVAYDPAPSEVELRRRLATITNAEATSTASQSTWPDR